MAAESTHDPRDFTKGLQQLLISDTKRLGFLGGAGTSIAVKSGGSPKSKVPGVKEMTDTIVQSVIEPGFQKALALLKDEFTDSKTSFLVEYILSNLEQKIQVVGKEKLIGLSKQELERLKDAFIERIKDLVSVHKFESEFLPNLVHKDFAEWIGNASRKNAVEIFTTNYDYLFEIGLEYFNIPYFDGFVGAYKPFFDPNSVADLKSNPGWTKLWKLHGSLGWELDKTQNRIIRTNKSADMIVIYPSIAKYDNSRKQPYVSFMDRLSSFLRGQDGVLFIVGYSFGDQHINDIILNGLSQTRSSHAIAFIFDDVTEASNLAGLARAEPGLSIYGPKSAVIGGKYGKWCLRAKPAEDEIEFVKTYFKFDEGATPFKGEGDLLLVDFSSFVNFLKALQYDNFRESWSKKP